MTESFNDRITDDEERKKLGCDDNDKILGPVHFVVSERGGELEIKSCDGGGFFTEEMKPHMNNKTIKHIRDAYAEVLKGFRPNHLKMFDIE